ncbi:hypothetical protein EXM22_03910 [Oceanispirochaeta crateris]|uniref:Uncharacterized protein n=1 Tax=Oceanispirochaeta crateris TaxID=2518645 RepID=A0A5C1QKQ1_9SPIO|nr:hypothetical protein [Oceanispirochaeta crateris]QEN07174.1 hypothetical protein EXM22_03910 [Oceanispirochaeta crateris]
MQIYFLVVFTHLLGGFVLSSHFLDEKIEDFASCTTLLNNNRFKLVLGIVTVLTALFTLLKVSPADVIIIGDILPAVSGFLLGGYFILCYFYEHLDESRSWMKGYVDFMEDRGHFAGLAAVIIAILHFLVPSALII